MLVVMPVIASPARVFAEPTDVLDVVVFADGRLQIGDRPVDEAQLEAAARQLVTAVGRDRARATIAADRAVPYARMIEVIDALQRGGLQQISMLVAPEGS
jgi:biopolymer transport protein TolR